MRLHLIAAVALALFVSACETIAPSPVSTTPPPSTQTPRANTETPGGPVDLGDWRDGEANAVTDRFSAHIARRYAAGATLYSVMEDLRRQSFVCAPSTAARGDPPDQVCRRTIKEAGCTHTWSIFLYDSGGNQRLARTRGLYDERCGGDGLLGG
jgi:hypothetical protein